MLCSKCQQFCKYAAKEIRIPDNGNVNALPDPGHVRWGHFSTVLHHSLGQLKAASDQRCPICRTIYSKHLKRERAHLPENCTILLEIKKESPPNAQLWTILRVNGKDLINRPIARGFGPVADGEFAYTLLQCAEVENNSTGSDASFKLAKFWLSRCFEKHSLCSRSRLSQPFMPSRVLGVSAGMVRLIETNNEPIAEADKRFTALSHCWGSVQIIKTTRSSLESHLQGIQTDQLSQTFLDAIIVTRNLSYRYLWIDSLCIIQDDSADWEKEAAEMYNIYQSAELTISAAHASGGNIGCFKKRDGIAQLPFNLNFPITEVGEHTKSTLQTVFAPLPVLDDMLDSAPPLYGCAWVLQEQVLSPRMLIFEGAQLKWDCLCMCNVESIPVDRGPHPHHDIIRRSIAKGGDFFYGADYGNRDPTFMWYQIITNYTTRGITKPSDRLAAIAGIANSIREKTTNQYLAGLWRDQLLSGLLWSIPHNPGEYDASFSFDMDRNERIRHPIHIAPSWSWGSVTAPVLFMFGRFQDLCKIQEVHVTGTDVCQTGRLQILGHIRVVHVNSVYPYAIREAAGKYGNMQCTNQLRDYTHCGRSFSPNCYFLCSQRLPRKDSDWQLICGYWRPDEVLNPNAEITFIAIGQNHRYESEVNNSRHPSQVYTLGLVPTGHAANEYRRVGYGVWSGCAWYGYSCSFRDLRLEPPIHDILELVAILDGDGKDLAEATSRRTKRPACWS